MKNCSIPRTALWLLLTLSILSPPIAAQTRRTSPARRPTPPPRVAVKEPVPTFDTLLAAGSYKAYGEIRGVGSLIRSAGVNDLLDPLIKFSSPPKEFRTLVKWLHAHADELTSSRLLIAAWPNKPKLPQFICAIEFASEEEAARFEPELNNLLPKLLPSPTPSPSPTGSASPSPAVPQQKPAAESGNASSAPQELKPPFLLKHSGTLVMLSDTKFSFKDLRPAGSKLLHEDENFRLAHNRFNSEPLFLYIDLKTEDRNQPPPEPAVKEAQVQIAEEQADVSPDPEEPTELTVTAPTEPASPDGPTLLAGQVEQNPKGESAEPKSLPAFNLSFSRLGGFLFDGPPRWPEAIAVGAAFEPETYVIRALLLNSDENKDVLIPFLPQLRSGPPLSPAAPTIFPADTELLMSASLDFAQIHDSIIKSAQREREPTRRRQNRNVEHVPQPSPFEGFEKTLGISLQKDLLPLLGNEIAFSLPIGSAFFDAPKPPPQEETPDATQPKTPPEEPAVVLAISLRDREGMRALLPRMIESLGIKGASMLAQTERREDTELVSYGNILSYAFVGDFLVSSTNSKAVRRFVDSYLNRQTLASDSNFHSFTRWQPRQVLGQVYVSTALTESYESYAEKMNTISDERLRDFLTGLTPANEPITYALSNEGLGPLHELHVPRKFVLMMVAGISASPDISSLAQNESMAQGSLHMIASAQQTFKSTKGDGRFGSLQELIDESLLPKDSMERFGYRIDLLVSGTTFEARATPIEYGKTGKRSFFIDESLVLRGGDHGGGPATVADKPMR